MAASTARALKNVQRLRISNLPWTVASEQLKQYFSKYGHIADAKVQFDLNTGLSRGNGYIDVTDKGTCQAILSTSNHSLDGFDLYVRKWIDSN